MKILSNFLSKIQNWIYLWVWFIITVWLVGITYAAITQVASWDILTAAKFNSLIDASYHTASFKNTTADFTVNTTTWTSDPNWNISINVKNNDLIYVSLDWSMAWGSTSVCPGSKINLISGPGVYLTNNNHNVLGQGASWYPFNIITLIKATWDGIINLWYQWQCGNPWTCTFRDIELKAFTIWKYQ